MSIQELFKNKRFLIGGGAVLVVLIILLVVVSVVGKEGFTDLGGDKKVMVTDKDGNIELYSVSSFVNGLNSKYSDYDDKIKRLNDLITDLQGKVSNNSSIINYHFPKGKDFGNSVLTIDGRTINGAHMDALLGKRDILIHNPKGWRDRGYLHAVSDRVDARFYDGTEARGTVNPRLRLEVS